MKTVSKMCGLTSLLLLVPVLLAVSAWAQESQPFKAEELDQMLAPIALYPDALLSQVLMVSRSYDRRMGR
jgi:Protein of unknown function (DUF3300)